jgi:catechol 2,3-dioxygenase-like lactoylglutathione lyase family enzyme
MAIIPTVRCRNMKTSLAFYTGVLDFERVDGDEELADPSFSVLSRNGDQLFLSSHRGDGEFGQVVAVMTDDVDSVCRKFRGRGCSRPGIRRLPSTFMKARSIRVGARASFMWTILMATRSGSLSMVDDHAA